MDKQHPLMRRIFNLFLACLLLILLCLYFWLVLGFTDHSLRLFVGIYQKPHRRKIFNLFLACLLPYIETLYLHIILNYSLVILGFTDHSLWLFVVGMHNYMYLPPKRRIIILFIACLLPQNMENHLQICLYFWLVLGFMDRSLQLFVSLLHQHLPPMRKFF